MNNSDKLMAAKILNGFQEKQAMATILGTLIGSAPGNKKNRDARSNSAQGGALRGVGRGALTGLGADIGGGALMMSRLNQAFGAKSILDRIKNPKARALASVLQSVGAVSGGAFLGDRIGKGLTGEYGYNPEG